MAQEDDKEQTPSLGDFITQLGQSIQGLAAATGPRPIGVPVGYEPPIRGSGFRPPPGAGMGIGPDDLRPSPYVDGDEYRPASFGPERIPQIQDHLRAVGLLTGEYTRGSWDTATQNAYRKLLEYANGLGTTDEYALRHLQASGGTTVDTTPSAPLVARVTNPEDIIRAARDGVRERLGFVPDDIDWTALVQKKQTQEVDYQRQVHSAQQGGGGTITAPMEMDTFADIEAKRADPTAYDSRKVVDAADYLARKLRGEV